MRTVALWRLLPGCSRLRSTADVTEARDVEKKVGQRKVECCRHEEAAADGERFLGRR